MYLRRGIAIGTVTLGVCLIGSANASTTRPVAVRDNVFGPAALTAVMGDTVKWTNSGIFTHTTTSTMTGPMGWHKVLGRGASYPKTLPAAGTYAYRCTLHVGMNGSVRIPVSVTPARGPVNTTFTVKLSTAPAASGYQYGPEVKAPGSSAWTRLAPTAAISARYKATRAGTYSFRSSVKHGTAPGTAPSPVKTVTVG